MLLITLRTQRNSLATALARETPQKDIVVQTEVKIQLTKMNGISNKWRKDKLFKKVIVTMY
jgi:hypothetical protein